MAKNNQREVLNEAEEKAKGVKPEPEKPVRKMDPTSGVERDLREAEEAR